MKKAINDRLAEEIKLAGLNYQAVLVHIERISSMIEDGEVATQNHQPQFEIVDTCRQDNHKVHSTSLFNQVSKNHLSDHPNGFVAFTPAAGASTRYSQPLIEAIKELGEDQGFQKTTSKIGKYFPVLAQPTIELLQNWSEKQSTTAELASQLSVPKAFQFCIQQKMTFLTAKLKEHQALGFLDHQVFITPPGFERSFREHCQSFGGHAYNENISFLPQDRSISTIRISKTGEPIRDTKGKISIVPAGHGALIHKFSQIKKIYKKAHSLFIRNIDNVSGIQKESISDTENFLAKHKTILFAVKKIRNFLSQNNEKKASLVAEELLIHLPKRAFSTAEQQFFNSLDQNKQSLYKLAVLLFQLAIKTDKKIADLSEIYAKPVCTMGQVRNTGKDVGGLPVVVNLNGSDTTVCLELPHASLKDRQRLLSDPTLATHFNPVFVAFELPENDNWVEKIKDNPFWLIAQKKWQGQDVYYHESVLYEILGNSEYTNTVFIEIPRTLFNPHKSLNDTIKMSPLNAKKFEGLVANEKKMISHF